MCSSDLHNPPPDADQYSLIEHTHPAWERMKFDELLAQQLSLKRAQAARRTKGATALPVVGHLSAAFLMSLPFALTGAQERVLAEIRADLKQDFPMQRLLQGDVGSGKTIVAALAAVQAIDSGFQAVLMPKGSSQAAILRKCCSAKISVGAISTA